MNTKKKLLTVFLAVAFFLSSAPCLAEAKIAIVNLKTCVESSKVGQEQQANIEKMRKQMEEVFSEKEKNLREVSTKLNDEDYLSSLSDEAEAELKHKFRSLNQELAQYQQQFMQISQQAQFKILQKIHDEISKAAEAVANEKKVDLVINEEGTFYYNPSLNISDDIVKVMDKNFKPEEEK